MEKAKFVSVWDDGVEIVTNCKFERATNAVFDIETVDICGLDLLVEEYVLLKDGTIIRDFLTEFDEDYFDNNFYNDGSSIRI